MQFLLLLLLLQAAATSTAPNTPTPTSTPPPASAATTTATTTTTSSTRRVTKKKTTANSYCYTYSCCYYSQCALQYSARSTIFRVLCPVRPILLRILNLRSGLGGPLSPRQMPFVTPAADLDRRRLEKLLEGFAQGLQLAVALLPVLASIARSTTQKSGGFCDIYMCL